MHESMLLGGRGQSLVVTPAAWACCVARISCYTRSVGLLRGKDGDRLNIYIYTYIYIYMCMYVYASYMYIYIYMYMYVYASVGTGNSDSPCSYG